MNNAYLLTGGNVGNRFLNLQEACEQISKKAGNVLKKSVIYETAPWGLTDQNVFLNQVLLVSTALPAPKLLQTLLEIEIELGRKRTEKMGPRTIDIDILFYNNDVISSPPDLVVPHPQIANRRFVLTPLSEVAPDFVHPVLGKTVDELLTQCADLLKVEKYKEF